MSTAMLYENFLANLRKALVRHGMTQRGLAEKSGVHFVTVNRILRGFQDPTLDVCEKLADAVGIDPPKIFHNASK